MNAIDIISAGYVKVSGAWKAMLAGDISSYRSSVFNIQRSYLKYLNLQFW
jgi:hypothetical protein